MMDRDCRTVRKNGIAAEAGSYNVSRGGASG